MPNESFYKRVPVSVPHRSGFDKSFRNIFTAECGTLVPILCDEVIPNTSVHLDLALSAQLPPLASETFMNVDYKVEAFFCPTRLLMPDYELWLTGNDKFGASFDTSYIRTPVFAATPGNCTAGSLMDYLGVMKSTDVGQGYYVSAFPMLCYHRIYDDWYRNSLVQKSIYVNQLEYTIDNGSETPVYAPYTSKWCTPTELNNNYILTGDMVFADDVTIASLRQRNFGFDYFTMATPSAQNGEVQKVSMSVPGLSRFGANDYRFQFGGIYQAGASSGDPIVAGSGGSMKVANVGDTNAQISFTVPALRAVNSMQMFLERNNLIGNRLVDFVKGQYGATLKDSIAQRPVYLGSYSFPVYSKGVYQSNQETSNDVASQNPFNSVGARYGHAFAEGNGSLIDFTAEEPGYIMVIGSLVPEVTYSTGIERYLHRYVERSSQSDMANPILQNVGNQPIWMSELCSSYFFNDNHQDGVFGYVERYADWKTRNHQLHGLLRDGKSLQSFALQRTFAPPTASTDKITINTEFLQIPTNYMDQVSAVNGAISQFGVWVDCYFKYAVSMPLYEYSLPSLQDPAWEHGDVFTIPRGGNKID